MNPIGYDVACRIQHECTFHCSRMRNRQRLTFQDEIVIEDDVEVYFALVPSRTDAPTEAAFEFGKYSV